MVELGASCKRKSSGFDFLWSELGSISPAARHEVFNLLGTDTVANLRRRADESVQRTNTNALRGSTVQRQIVTNTMTEDEALSLADASKLSLLGSICVMFDATSASDSDLVAPPARRTAMEIVKQCGFAVDPLRSPGRLDARSMVLAALFFLCETSYLKPVHKATTSKVSADLTKRSYEKAFDWKWDDIGEKVTGELEDAFYDDDPRHYEFLSRKRFLPAPTSESNGDRLQLLLRGVIPTPVGKVSSQHQGNTQST